MDESRAGDALCVATVLAKSCHCKEEADNQVQCCGCTAADGQSNPPLTRALRPKPEARLVCLQH